MRLGPTDGHLSNIHSQLGGELESEQLVPVGRRRCRSDRPITLRVGGRSLRLLVEAFLLEVLRSSGLDVLAALVFVSHACLQAAAAGVGYHRDIVSHRPAKMATPYRPRLIRPSEPRIGDFHLCVFGGCPMLNASWWTLTREVLSIPSACLPLAGVSVLALVVVGCSAPNAPHFDLRRTFDHNLS